MQVTWHKNNWIQFLPGLVSNGGVHSHIDHAKGLLTALKELTTRYHGNNAPPTFVHFFSDGRDTKPTSGVGFMKEMLEFIDSLGYGSLATVTGRYFLQTFFVNSWMKLQQLILQLFAFFYYRVIGALNFSSDRMFVIVIRRMARYCMKCQTCSMLSDSLIKRIANVFKIAQVDLSFYTLELWAATCRNRVMIKFTF